MKATSRDVNGVEIVKLEGKITIGAGDSQLREVISNALGSGTPTGGVCRYVDEPNGGGLQCRLHASNCRVWLR